MKTSDSVLVKIGEFEGCRLTAYKPIPQEKYWTIGFGRCSPEIYEGMTITKEQALQFFREDITRFENYVTATGLELTQNQFDALVSFTYNCGAGNLQKLIRNRALAQIADAILLYNKGANGQTLPGLVRRRQWEHDLFVTGMERGNEIPYPMPTKNLRMNSRGNDVRWLQMALTKKGYSLVCDGIFGVKTDEAVRAFQADRGLIIDGIVGPATRGELLK